MSERKFKNYEEEKEYKRLAAEWDRSPETLRNEFIDFENFFHAERRDANIRFGGGARR